MQNGERHLTGGFIRREMGSANTRLRFRNYLHQCTGLVHQCLAAAFSGAIKNFPRTAFISCGVNFNENCNRQGGTTKISCDVFAMNTPFRVQLSRKKGWRMPRNTVKVCRPGKWGNPYAVADYGRDLAVANYRCYLEGLVASGSLNLAELRGKNLACWCKLDEACHADVLLFMANS